MMIPVQEHELAFTQDEEERIAEFDDLHPAEDEKIEIRDSVDADAAIVADAAVEAVRFVYVDELGY